MRKANGLLQIPADYQHLPVPVPPMLEKAIGYEPGKDHEADFVSFYWQPAGDEATYDDGILSGSGSWQHYLLFVEHAKVAPALVDQDKLERIKSKMKLAEASPLMLWHLSQINLGSSDGENDFRLVLDLRTRLIYALPESDAADLLMRQWTPDGGKPKPPTPEERDAAFQTFLKLQEAMMNPDSELYKSLNRLPTPEEISERFEASQKLYDEMAAWLAVNDYRQPAAAQAQPEAQNQN